MTFGQRGVLHHRRARAERAAKRQIRPRSRPPPIARRSAGRRCHHLHPNVGARSNPLDGLLRIGIRAPTARSARSVRIPPRPSRRPGRCRGRQTAGDDVRTVRAEHPHRLGRQHGAGPALGRDVSTTFPVCPAPPTTRTAAAIIADRVVRLYAASAARPARSVRRPCWSRRHLLRMTVREQGQIHRVQRQVAPEREETEPGVPGRCRACRSRRTCRRRRAAPALPAARRSAEVQHHVRAVAVGVTPNLLGEIEAAESVLSTPISRNSCRRPSLPAVAYLATHGLSDRDRSLPTTRPQVDQNLSSAEIRARSCRLYQAVADAVGMATASSSGTSSGSVTATAHR